MLPPHFDHLDEYGLMFIGAVIGALCILLPLALAVYVFFQRFATKEELAKLDAASKDRYAENKLRAEQVELRTQADIKEMELRVTNAVGENRSASSAHFLQIGAKLDEMTRSMQLWVTDTARATGAIEGQISMLVHPQPHPRATA